MMMIVLKFIILSQGKEVSLVFFFSSLEQHIIMRVADMLKREREMGDGGSIVW